MKQKPNNHQSEFKNPKLERDIKCLIETVQSYGEEDSFSEINDDLLTFAMPEFVASETFIEMHSGRRKELLAQFLLLRSLLEHLQKFVSVHPSWEEIDHHTILN